MNFEERTECEETTVRFIFSLLKFIADESEDLVINWDALRAIINQYAKEENKLAREIVLSESDGEITDYQGWFPTIEDDIDGERSEFDEKVLRQILGKLGF